MSATRHPLRAPRATLARALEPLTSAAHRADEDVSMVSELMGLLGAA